MSNNRKDPMLTTVAPDRSAVTLTLPLDVLSNVTVIAPPAAMLSQLNIEREIGMPARTFLEMIRAPGFPVSVKCVGKLRLVHREDFVAYLDTLTAGPPSNTSRAPNDARGNADEVEDLLREMGYERTAKPVRARRAR